MVRGTTPTFELTVEGDIDLTQMDNVYATFTQDCYKVTKTGDDLVISAKEVDVYMTQEETLKFKKGTLLIQLNWTFQNGRRACTNILKVNVSENLEEKVLA